jgi:hypothetical protein
VVLARDAKFRVVCLHRGASAINASERGPNAISLHLSAVVEHLECDGWLSGKLELAERVQWLWLLSRISIYGRCLDTRFEVPVKCVHALVCYCTMLPFLLTSVP